MDKEKVIECLQKAKMVIETWVPMFEQYNTPSGIDDAIAILKEQEAVVRCKDCKWNSGTAEKPFCMMRSVPSPADWFCADGERKNG